MNKVLLIFLIFCVTALNAQINRSLEAFDKINVFGKINVRIEKSNLDSVVVESSQFDVEKVKCEIVDGELNIRLLSEFPPAIKVNATIYYKDSITVIAAGGGVKLYNKGEINGSNFKIKSGSGSEFDLLINVDTLDVKVSKGAFVRLTGSSKLLNLVTSTGGAFRSTKMDNLQTYAVLNGGTAEIKTAKYLNAKVLLGGSLLYLEEPDKIVRKERLGGTIDKLDDF